jgi:putative Holliday junction resolvase
VSRILGLDVGERRIGVAISDPERRLAVPLRILEAADDATIIARLAAIAQEEGATEFVLGHPLSLDGTVGPQAQRIESFARRLAQVTGLPVHLQDERLTSVEAARPPGALRRRMPKSLKRRRGPSDDLAAAAILQRYLDRQRAPRP